MGINHESISLIVWESMENKGKNHKLRARIRYDLESSFGHSATQEHGTLGTSKSRAI